MERRRLVTVAGNGRVAAVAAALLGTLLAGCGGAGAEEVTTPASDAEASCEGPSVREPQSCAVVRVADESFRYAVVGDLQAKTLVLVDPGGPGVSALAGEGPSAIVGAFGLPQGAGRAYLVLEEPWVTRSPDRACARAGRGFVARPSLRSPQTLRRAALAMKDACASSDLGWRPERYRAVVAEIERARHARVTGFAGASFAARRLRWLQADHPTLRTALVNPLPPGVDFDEVLAHQAAGLPAGRSALGLANRAAYERSHHALRPPSAVERNAYLGRYGDGLLSPGRIAYFQEMCATGAVAPAPRGATALAWLRAVHACGRPSQATQMPAAEVDCITASSRDLVVPLTAVRRVYRGTRIQVTRHAHADPRLSGGCLRIWKDVH